MADKQNKDIMVRFRISEEENKQLEELAQKVGISKSKLIRSLIFGELDDAKLLQNLGSLPIIQRYKEFVKSL